LDEYEPILRRIRELEERIREREEFIKTMQEAYRLYETEYYTAIRERDYEATIKAFVTMSRIMETIRATRAWITRFRRMIEELRRAIPPYKERMHMTFSIDTSRGKEPFFAEVTLETILKTMPIEERRTLESRVVNAALKFFWIHFDGFKDVHRGEPLFPWLLRLVKHPDRIEEEEMDRFLLKCVDAGKLQRNPDEYVTTQATIKIGVEYYPTSEDVTYPEVRITVEKKEPEKKKKVLYRLDKTIIMAKESKFDITKKLGMEVMR
jgi:hypothetical protein